MTSSFSGRVASTLLERLLDLLILVQNRLGVNINNGIYQCRSKQFAGRHDHAEFPGDPIPTCSSWPRYAGNNFELNIMWKLDKLANGRADQILDLQGNRFTKLIPIKGDA